MARFLIITAGVAAAIFAGAFIHEVGEWCSDCNPYAPQEEEHKAGGRNESGN